MGTLNGGAARDHNGVDSGGQPLLLIHLDLQPKQQPLPNILHNIHYSSLCNNTTHSHDGHLHQVTAHSSLINKQNTISLVQHSNNIICHTSPHHNILLHSLVPLPLSLCAHTYVRGLPHSDLLLQKKPPLALPQCGRGKTVPVHTVETGAGRGYKHMCTTGHTERE